MNQQMCEFVGAVLGGGGGGSSNGVCKYAFWFVRNGCGVTGEFKYGHHIV
jgi:hypothetical protein